MAHYCIKYDNVPFFVLPSAWDFAILHCVMAKQSNLSFFGREEIIDRLETLWGKRVPSLVTCRGRRRIGKTTLIEKFANRSKARFIKLEGLKPKDKMSNADQLSAFASQLALQTHAERTIPTDWLSAFARLDGEIRDEGRTVVLLDEISWMAYYDVTFAGSLKVAWDNLFKKHRRLVLVVCGSVSSWIKDWIIDSGDFYGRRSLDIVVPELPLSECVKFWGTTAGRIDMREIIDVLSVTGGVPRYLEEVNPSLSAADNLRNMFFIPHAPLAVDFDEMFSEVITEQPTFTARVLRSLVDGRKSVSEIARLLDMQRNGHVSRALDRLEECGLITADAESNPETGETAREKIYRLSDNHARFYLRYVEPLRESIDRDAYEFISLDALPGWETSMGLAFENLVVNNFRSLAKFLHLGKAPILYAAPFRKRPSKGTGGEGLQIDLLVRQKRTLWIVEIKRKRNIGHDVIDEVERKAKRLHVGKDVSLRRALVYDGELAPIVEAEGYFDALVRFSDLLGL